MTKTTRLTPGDKAPGDADATTCRCDYEDAGHRVLYPQLDTGMPPSSCDFATIWAIHHCRLNVVGISPDKPEKLATFRDAQGLTFPLLF
ncbi:bacterioferritin comigratory protein bcp [Mycobacterium tuberculosis T17]|nr:bacterioferritin comigratory protein bcp [Mycobacterium tuberculosis T17]